MAGFLTSIACVTKVPAITIGNSEPMLSDPAFTHWVVELGKIVGEAHSVRPASDGLSFAYVRLFRMPELAEYGRIATKQLRAKANGAHA